MLKAIVFDFDGVIVNSEPLHYRAFLKVAQRELDVNFTYEQYLNEYIGFDDRDAFRELLKIAKRPRTAITNGDADVAKLCEFKAHAFEEVVHEGIDPIPGMLALIEEAAAALPIGISSGATRADIDLILKRLNLTHRFADIISADDVAKSKPDPTCYRLAVQALARRHPKLALQPGDCLSIEDTTAGIASARGAGLKTLGLATTAEPERLHSAHRVVRSAQGLTLAQLRQWFG